jgi:hypothetical protein
LLPLVQGKRRLSNLSLTRTTAATAAKTGALLLAHAWTADETFRPVISPRARLMPSRSLSQLHDGGRVQRERALVGCCSCTCTAHLAGPRTAHQ